MAQRAVAENSDDQAAVAASSAPEQFLVKSSGHVELDYLAVVGAYGEFRFDTSKLPNFSADRPRRSLGGPEGLPSFYIKEFKFER